MTDEGFKFIGTGSSKFMSVKQLTKWAKCCLFSFYSEHIKKQCTFLRNSFKGHLSLETKASAKTFYFVCILPHSIQSFHLQGNTRCT
ncbi:hypothetical protein FKM82_012913 [Ascaphus truei]